MISAYILPHPPAAVKEVGYRDIEVMKVTLEAYEKASLMIKEDAPETVVIISPHAPMFSDGFYIAGGISCSGDLSQFGAAGTGLSFDYDTQLRDEICELSRMENIPYGLGIKDNDHMDHGTIVPLTFLTQQYRDFKLVRVSPAYLSSDILLKMGRIIERAAAHTGRRTTIIASADLSHRLKEDGPYGFAAEGPVFDEKITSAMKSFDVDKMCALMDDHDFLERAGQCGMPSVTMMAGAIRDYMVEADFLSYEGPFGVGYAVCAYKCEDECVRLAKKALETYIQTGTLLKSYEKAFDKPAPDYMKKDKAGVFVCLKKAGGLRGCIGTFLPTTDCVSDEVIRLAVEAGTKDPRFNPVEADELCELKYTVDILSKPEKAAIEDLDVKRYGVIVSNGYRRGLLLPDLEGVDTIEYQLAIALNKAGISPDENFEIERFTVERHT